LLQRDRNFNDYEDLAARYDLRPTLWVQPKGQWASGTVELVEIPATTEYNDNIVAYWIPKEQFAAGREYHWAYSLSTAGPTYVKDPPLMVQSTRITPEHDKVPPRLVIDFADPPNSAISNHSQIEAKVQASRGEIHNLVTQTNEVTGGWRAFFDLTGAGAEPVDVRLVLQDGNQTVSETWVYHFQNP
jgi:glucans biosynthesis protein